MSIHLPRLFLGPKVDLEKQSNMRILRTTGGARDVNAFEGRVIKCFKSFTGPNAAQRFQNECRVLRHLNELECPFVPRLLDSSSVLLSITTEHCGQSVEQLSEEHVQQLFDRLLEYGVRHDDPVLRNVLYDSRSNEFKLIDFESAEILEVSLSVLPRIEQSLADIENAIEEHFA